ncbi:MATE family efflux transporter [Candidatus Allofournierella excrementavium]|uniref:MATE family efflux transporter n=1 Tax=Candidatus Allofournierella excrementavium TaxID=2838591 RepID=UPI00374E353A
MRIRFSDHFTCKKLLRLTFPSMIMLVFTSIYGVVDGFFVSNFVGKNAFTAVNFIMPFLMILGAVGFMFGTGGGALIAKTLGEGDKEKAGRLFSLVVYASAGLGVVLAAAGLLLLRPLLVLLGAEGQLLENCVLYGRIILLANPMYILQYEFQCLFPTAGKPALGLYVTVAAGLTNMVLDALFVAVLPWGIQGAAAATAISQCVGGLIPLVYFALPNRSLLRLGPTRMEPRALGKVCANGSSELMSNISIPLVSMLYNLQLLAMAGEDGVAAYGVLMYVSLIFQAVFLGCSVGTAPVISYHYGARNAAEVKGILRRSLGLISVFALAMFAAALGLAQPLSRLFVGYDQALYELTVRAFGIFAFSFLCTGFAIFGSAFFTALNNGLVSAVISFLRTLLFQVAAVLILPLFWQVDGIWAATVAAECMAALVAGAFLWRCRDEANLMAT